MTEREFCADLVKGLRNQGMIAHKYPDSARALVKPYDIIASTYVTGKYWAIEAKMTRIQTWESDMKVLEWRDFSTNQVRSLRQVYDAGCEASIVLAVCPPEARNMRAWLFPASRTLEWLESLAHQNEGLRLQEILLRQTVPELVRIPCYGWGLSIPRDTVSLGT